MHVCVHTRKHANGGIPIEARSLRNHPLVRGEGEPRFAVLTHVERSCVFNLECRNHRLPRRECSSKIALYGGRQTVEFLRVECFCLPGQLGAVETVSQGLCFPIPAHASPAQHRSYTDDQQHQNNNQNLLPHRRRFSDTNTAESVLQEEVCPRLKKSSLTWHKELLYERLFATPGQRGRVEADVKFIACQMPADLLEFDQSEFIDQVEYVRAAIFHIFMERKA